MEITPRSRLLLKAQNLITVLLFLTAVGLLGWISTQYNLQTDWTHGKRHTLSTPSRQMLSTLSEEVRITAFARENKLLRERISDLVGRYQRFKPDIALSFVNPDTNPERMRQLGINKDGTLSLQYRGDEVLLNELNEQALTNALLRLARQDQRWVVFLTDHGERNPEGEANHDLGNFGSELRNKGFSLQRLSLSETPQIPGNTSVLVIAGPAVELLDGEVQIIRDHVRNGGNLLWLADPGGLYGLAPLATDLGIEFFPGTVVDAATRALGIDDPAFALVSQYPANAITHNFLVLTLYPQAVALDASEADDNWEVIAFLRTLDRSWTETAPISGTIHFDEELGERRGPLTIGVSMQRSHPTPVAAGPPDESKTTIPTQQEQRVVVIGDGDFLSNAYLGNGGNLDLGLKIVNWLSHDDRFIKIAAKTAPDAALNLTEWAILTISLGFLFFVPVLFLIGGLSVWLVRRRR